MPTYNESGLTTTEQDERKTVVYDDIKEHPLIHPLMEIKTMADLLEEFKEEKRKLKEDIDNQPVINLNEILKSKKKNKLPSMEDAKIIPSVPPHLYCKQDPAELCRQVDELYRETFGDLEELFKKVPSLRRFEEDML